MKTDQREADGNGRVHWADDRECTMRKARAFWGYGRVHDDLLEDAVQNFLAEFDERSKRGCRPAEDECLGLLRRHVRAEQRRWKKVAPPEYLDHLREAQRRETRAAGRTSDVEVASSSELLAHARRCFAARTFRAFFQFAILNRPAADVADELGMTTRAVYLCVFHVRSFLRREYRDTWKQIQRSCRPARGRRRQAGADATPRAGEECAGIPREHGEPLPIPLTVAVPPSRPAA